MLLSVDRNLSFTTTLAIIIFSMLKSSPLKRVLTIGPLMPLVDSLGVQINFKESGVYFQRRCHLKSLLPYGPIITKTKNRE